MGIKELLKLCNAVNIFFTDISAVNLVLKTAIDPGRIRKLERSLTFSFSRERESFWSPIYQKPRPRRNRRVCFPEITELLQKKKKNSIRKLHPVFLISVDSLVRWLFISIITDSFKFFTTTTATAIWKWNLLILIATSSFCKMRSQFLVGGLFSFS